MNKASVDFSMIKEQLMKDQEFKKAHENLKPRYELISEVIKARTELNIIQEEFNIII